MVASGPGGPYLSRVEKGAWTHLASLGTRRGRRQFAKFLAVGVLNTAVGYGIFAILLQLGLHYAVAAFLSTILGVLFNFQTIGGLVFGSRDPALIVRFFAVYGVTYLVNVGALRVLEATRLHVLASQALLLAPLAVLSFVLNQRFVFERAVEREVAGS